MACGVFGRRRRRLRSALAICGVGAIWLIWLFLSQEKKTTSEMKGVFKPEVTILKETRKETFTNNLNNCSFWFEEDLESNLRVIENYPKGDVGKYLSLTGGDLTEPLEMTSFPVVVTAANAQFFKVTEALVQSVDEILRPKYTDLRIVYYDLGLTDVQKTLLKKHCRCEVRSFPFSQFPEHVHQLKTYAWKPLIIQKALMDFGAVWWLDASARFVTADLEQPIEYARQNGILFFTYGPSLSVAQNTDSQTMRFLNEDVCKFRQFGEIEAGFGLYYWHNVTRVLVRNWAACALNSQCIAPPGTSSKLHCNLKNTQDGRCHRFDQSVLSIMARRLYHDKNDYPDVEEPFRIHVIRRGQTTQYFPLD